MGLEVEVEAEVGMHIEIEMGMEMEVEADVDMQMEIEMGMEMSNSGQPFY